MLIFHSYSIAICWKKPGVNLRTWVNMASRIQDLHAFEEEYFQARHVAATPGPFFPRGLLQMIYSFLLHHQFSLFSNIFPSWLLDFGWLIEAPPIQQPAGSMGRGKQHPPSGNQTWQWVISYIWSFLFLGNLSINRGDFPPSHVWYRLMTGGSSWIINDHHRFPTFLVDPTNQELTESRAARCSSTSLGELARLMRGDRCRVEQRMGSFSKKTCGYHRGMGDTYDVWWSYNSDTIWYNVMYIYIYNYN